MKFILLLHVFYQISFIFINCILNENHQNLKSFEFMFSKHILKKSEDDKAKISDSLFWCPDKVNMNDEETYGRDSGLIMLNFSIPVN